MCWREGYSNKIFYEFKRIQKKMCQNAKNTLVK